jgi:hypothetical protein
VCYSHAALRLAQRDLEMHSSQLRRLTLKMTRAAWKVSPGDAIKISVPQRGIESMILRVGEVEESALTGEEITLKAVEDVFGLPDNAIVDPQESFWKPPDRSARVITDRDLTEQTYFDLADNLPSSQLADFAPNEGWIKMYAAQPSGAAVQYDLQTKAGGELAYVTRSTAGFDAVAYLVGDISHYQTNLTFTRGSLLGNVAARRARADRRRVHQAGRHRPHCRDDDCCPWLCRHDTAATSRQGADLVSNRPAHERLSRLCNRRSCFCAAC